MFGTILSHLLFLLLMLPQALSEALQLPLMVYSADMAPHLVGSDKDAPLRLSFHKHYLSLGAHYNSVVPALGEEP